MAALATFSATLTLSPALGWEVPQLGRFAAAFTLLFLLPALAWSRALPGMLLDRIAGGLGLAFVCSGFATLVLNLLPGPFPFGWSVGVYLLLALLPLELSLRRQPTGDPERLGWKHLCVAGVLLVAALVRLPNLGYSEFQGDEAVIMQRAAQALAGDDGELFLHQKGPVEILVPMSVWALSGTITEWQVRLPFALVGLLSVLVITCLADRCFGARAGVIAGLLLAINGFLVAFSRIVQYQNFVVAMGGLSLLWLLNYRRRGRLVDLVLAAVFLAYGLLAHYDTVLVVPAAAAVAAATVLAPGGAGKQALADHVKSLLVALLVGAAALGLFYVPFLGNPMFSRTLSYLAGGRVGGSLLHNSLLSVWRMSTFYNALAFVTGMIGLVVAAGVMRVGGAGAWLAFAVPFVFYCFVVVDPRTHVYTFYPGAAILAAGALSRAYTSLRRRWKHILVATAGIWYALCAGYIVIAFLNHRVEYKRAWPESRHPLYPVPFGDDDLPPYGHFGFPYRAGWKAVGSLFADGLVHGSYASNEEPEITTWYVRSGVRTMCDSPDVYVIAENVQDEIAVDWGQLDRDYGLVATINVEGQPKIRLYDRASRSAAPVSLAAQDYIRAYDEGATVASQLPFGYGLDAIGDHGVGADFGSVARLLGYDVSDHVLRQGGTLKVTLYWRALSSPERNYQVFTHLVASDVLIAQDDGAPACAQAPTSLWEYGEIVIDEHLIELDGDVPLGEFDLTVGMYDLLTFARLPVDGGPSDRLSLTAVEVIP